MVQSEATRVPSALKFWSISLDPVIYFVIQSNLYRV